MSESYQDPRELLGHSAWINRLAWRLVMDAATAEDLAQDALILALERPPEARVPLRAWLSGVLRNLERERRRAERRRRFREGRQAEGSKALQGPEDPLSIAQRLDLSARLVEAVRALEEPYQSAIALRFLDELSPTQIAERLGVPVKTVHSRIERGLAKLRAEFDRSYGGRERWAALLLPLVRPEVPAGLAPTAALDTTLLILMSTPKWALSALALCLGWFAWQGLHTPADEPLRAASSPTPELEVAREQSDGLSGSAPQAEGRNASLPAVSATEAIAEAFEVEALLTVRGRVLDTTGRGISGLALAFERPSSDSRSAAAPDSRFISGPDGSFELPWEKQPSSSNRVLATGAGWQTLWSTPVRTQTLDDPLTVWVGRAAVYRGRTWDLDETPLSGVQLEVALPPALWNLIQPGALASGQSLGLALSDGEGRFELGPRAWAPGMHLIASRLGYEPTLVELPEGGQDPLDVHLAPLGGEGLLLAGLVVDPAGQPIADAVVGTGKLNTRSDSDGRFALQLDASDLPERIQAIAEGWLPLAQDLADLPVESLGALPLELNHPAGQLSGRVLDAQGAPAAFAYLWTTDAERFGEVLHEMGGIRINLTLNTEDLLAGRTNPLGARDVRCREDGSFELIGLLERSYRVWAMHPATFEISGPFDLAAPASDVVLRLNAKCQTQAIAGQVTNLAGEPRGPVEFSVERRVPGTQVWRRVSDGGQTSTDGSIAFTFSLTTDAEGRFSVGPLCPQDTRLYFSDDQTVDLATAPDLSNIKVPIPAHCRLRIHLPAADSERAWLCSIQDQKGRPLRLQVTLEGISMQSSAFEITNGISDLIETTEAAATLILDQPEFSQHLEIPLSLKPGPINEIRF